ncbi:uncharacterized protein [Clytia hemisphaerica]|uniref:Uncharacterized protein n=1 Tax=Clytia hemisphaerica TaxID=252671 RepID=A0A7M6DRH8_9CNID
MMELLDKIIDQYPEIGEFLIESNYSSHSILMLEYKELKTLLVDFDAKLRCKVWRLIDDHSKSCDTPPISVKSDNSPLSREVSNITSSKRKLSDKENQSPPMNKEFHFNTANQGPSTKQDLPSSSRDMPSSSQDMPSSSRELLSLVRQPSIQRIVYTLYNDKEAINTERAGGLTPRLKERVIRMQIETMTTEAERAFQRKPTFTEIKEVAKSLAIQYPSLQDKDKPPGSFKTLYEKMRKCGYNRTQMERKVVEANEMEEKMNDYVQLHSRPKKIKFMLTESELAQSKEIKEENNNVHQNVSPAISQPNEELTTEESFQEEAVPEISKFLSLLDKEMKKSKPNLTVVNLYLDKTFSTRRELLHEKGQEEYIKMYPCFNSPVMLIEEVRRVLGKPNNSDNSYLNHCAQSLIENVDQIIYFGLDEKRIGIPKKPSQDGKLMHLMSNLNKIFGKLKKKSVKTQQIFVELADNEDPEEKMSTCKISTSCPILLIEKNKIHLLLHKKLLFSTERKCIIEAFVAYIASYYLVNMGYPLSLEIGLSVLQLILFKDDNIRSEIKEDVLKIHKEYQKF